MKIVRILGGLGNQMFQYAFSRELARRSGETVYLDLSAFQDYALHQGFELDRLFSLPFELAERKDVLRLSTPIQGIVNRLRRKYLTKKTHYIDRHFGFRAEILDFQGDRYYEGYWQTEKYFGDAREELRSLYTFQESLSDRNLSLLHSLHRPSCAIHVRRGDYLREKDLNICGDSYYKGALELLANKTGSATGAASYAIFSDDIAWCREHLTFPQVPVAFVDWNRGMQSWQDMAMMSLCDHHIIANSSFSWWSAWLGEKQGSVVVAPAIWNLRQRLGGARYYRFTYDDVLPERWLRAAV